MNSTASEIDGGQFLSSADKEYYYDFRNEKTQDTEQEDTNTTDWLDWIRY